MFAKFAQKKFALTKELVYVMKQFHKKIVGSDVSNWVSV